jgi:Nucleotide-diphospho-sugar transferase
VSDAFPLPFTSLRFLKGGNAGPYVVGAMFTEAYRKDAERLAASCETFGLPYVIHEVQAVHRSISPRGSEDLSFTKANFIRHLLTVHAKPVLYVDADCEFVSDPVLADELVGSRCDFAIYNWLADEHTDTFFPVDVSVGPDGPPIKNRFYRFNHSIDWYTTSQLFCSGAVQFYANSDAARMLLAEWQHTIAAFPGSADDVCLSFAFNNLGTRSDALKVHWLPKAYARYCWWIYVKPVINHSTIPLPRKPTEPDFVDINDPAGRRTFYSSRAEVRTGDRLFPRDCLIDTERGIVGKVVGDRLVTIEVTDQTFWL